MCQLDTKDRERFLQSCATDEERRSILGATQARLSTPDCFVGIAIWGFKSNGKTMFMSLAQVKRSEVRSDAEIFQELLINYELVAIAMREDGTWPCLEFLTILRAYSNFNVVRVFEDGSFERWRIDDVIECVKNKGNERRKRRRQP